MGLKLQQWLLPVIFLAVLSFRLFYAYGSSSYSFGSYFDSRQIESIKQTGLPFYFDALSYGGRQVFFLPTFHYLMAGISNFMPLALAEKIVPNFLMALLVFIVYGIAFETTRNVNASLVAGFVAGFSPVVFQNIMQVGPVVLAIPLMFFAVYCFMRISEPAFTRLFLVVILLLTFTHPVSLLLIAGLILYILLVKLEQVRHEHSEVEMVMLSALFVVWLTLVAFKKPLMVHGPDIVWQNVPSAVFGAYYSGLNMLSAVYLVGIIPFVTGIYTIYKYMFKEKLKFIYLHMSMALVAILMLWLKLIELDLGLLILGIILIILFSQGVKNLFIFLKKTKLARFEQGIWAAFLIILIAASVLPSISLAMAQKSQLPSDSEMKALYWLRDKAISNSTVVATPKEGEILAAVAKKSNVLDEMYLLAPAVDERFNDVGKIFTSSYEVEAIGLMNKYHVKYVLLTKEGKAFYHISKLSYSADEACFALVYDDTESAIYALSCTVEEYA